MTSAVMEGSNTPVSAQPVTKRKRKGQDVGIPVRQLGLTYDEKLPTLWFDNNGLLTMFFSGFSATLPEGEDQFVYSVRLFQDKITDPTLKAQVRAFIGQEAHHSREHESLNAALIERGFPLDKIERRIRAMNLWMRKYQSPAQQLAGTVCGEHITALMADYALTHPDFLNSVAEPTRTTWAWHCIEELEHKSVAFDVYDQLVGDRNLLRRAMITLTIFFLSFTTFHALMMMGKTGQLTNWKNWKEGFSTIWAMLKAVRHDYMDFFKADYHPWQHDCQETLKRAKLKYLNEQ